MPVKIRPSLHNAAQPTVLEERERFSHRERRLKERRYRIVWYSLLDDLVLSGAPRHCVNGSVSGLDEGFLGFR
jgi:hypothetical protein